MQYPYNKRGIVPSTQYASRGRGCSWGMNNTSFTHRGEHQQSNQNQAFCMYPAEREWYLNNSTQLGTLPHQYQEHQQSNQNQAFCMYPTEGEWYPNYSTQQGTLPRQYQMSASQERHVSDKVKNPKQSHENWKRMGQPDIVRLSKTLAFLLRHGAEKSGFHFLPGGFLYVDQLLKQHKPLRGFTLMQIQELVRTNDKQRFTLQQDPSDRWMIRANQGHSTAVEGLDLTPISDNSEIELVVHGTYYQAWEQIQRTGLSRMNRNHIHFAAGMPGESGVISGMRKSCEVVIEIDLEKALKAAIPFFRSANNVILSPGNDNGFIPPTFFKRVFDRRTGMNLQYPMKRMREDLSEDDYHHKRRKYEPKLGSEKERSEKEGITSKSGTSQFKQNDGGRTTSAKPQKEKDKEMAKQIGLKDKKVDRWTSRSDRSKTEKEGVAKSHNETENNMARQEDKTEEITKSHSVKGKERKMQMRREDEKEVEETSKYRSREGKGENRRF